MLRTFTAALERHPSLGYTSTLASISAGLIGLVETATKIGGLVSVLIGVCVGIYTLRIQRRAWIKAEQEDKQKK